MNKLLAALALCASGLAQADAGGAAAFLNGFLDAQKEREQASRPAPSQPALPRAVWTGRVEYVTTVTGLNAARCEYSLYGNTYYFLFANGQCATSVPVR